MRPLRAGVVGVGRLGAAHARLLAESPRFELVGVSDLDGDRAATIARANGVTAFPVDGLCDTVDAVVVAVPTSAHGEIGGRALEAGCHVLIEKPLAGTVDEAAALVRLARERDRILGVGHVERFNGILMACDPWLTRPRYLESLRLAPFQDRGTDVTVVLDLMIHDIDLVLALAGGGPVEVDAVGVPVITGSIDIANARLAFESGTVANITASRVSTRRLRQLRLFQKSGYFSLDLAAGTGEHLHRTERSSAGVAGIEDLVERVPLVPVEGEPLFRELEAFAAAIRGEPSRLVRGEQALEALDVAIRITREIEEFAHVVAQDP